MRHHNGILFVVAACCCIFFNDALSQAQQEQKQEPKFAGELFGIRVPADNYFFVKGVVMVFGNKFGEAPATPEEEEKIIWDQLLLSYEAFRRGVIIDQEEVEEEVAKIVEAEKAAFDWKTDKESYQKWLKEKVNESPELFENQIRHLLQLQKLRRQVMDGIEPRVTAKEARQEFMNEHNSLNVEIVQFGEKKDADKFYGKVKKGPKAWDEEKNKRPNDFKRMGLVSTEFLMDLWKFPKEDVYKMMAMKKDRMYPPFPIYSGLPTGQAGYAVCRIIETRPANKKDFSKFKDSFYEQIRRKKKNEGLNQWLENLKKQANIKIYKEVSENG